MRTTLQPVLTFFTAALLPATASAGAVDDVSSVLDKAGISPLQLFLIGIGALLLFVLLSAMYALIFRVVCRKAGKVPLEFRMMEGTLFFAWAPLLCSVPVTLLSNALQAMGNPPFFSVVLVCMGTLAGTAWLARQFLLKVRGDVLPYPRALCLMAGTFFAAWLIFTLAKLVLSFLM